jgi:hypothetical protein
LRSLIPAIFLTISMLAISRPNLPIITRPKVHGNVLKHGFGAMDTEALELLLQEQEDKEAEEEEVQRKKKEKKHERERKRLDDAEAKAEKA